TERHRWRTPRCGYIKLTQRENTRQPEVITATRVFMGRCVPAQMVAMNLERLSQPLIPDAPSLHIFMRMCRHPVFPSTGSTNTFLKATRSLQKRRERKCIGAKVRLHLSW